MVYYSIDLFIRKGVFKYEHSTEFDSKRLSEDDWMKKYTVFFIHALFVSPHKRAHCIARPGFRDAKWGLL